MSNQRLILPAVTNCSNSPLRGGEYLHELTAGSINDRCPREYWTDGEVERLVSSFTRRP